MPPPRVSHRTDVASKGQDQSSGSEGNSPQIAPTPAPAAVSSATFVVSSSQASANDASKQVPIAVNAAPNPYADPWGYYGAYMDPSMMYGGYNQYEMAAAWYGSAAAQMAMPAEVPPEVNRTKTQKGGRHLPPSVASALPQKVPHTTPPKACYLIRVQYHVLHVRFHRFTRGFAPGTWVNVSDARGVTDMGVVLSSRPFVACSFDDEPVTIQPAAERDRQAAQDLEQAAAAVVPTLTQIIVNSLPLCNFTQRLNFLGARFRSPDRIVIYYQSGDTNNSPRVLVEALAVYYPNCEIAFERLPMNPWTWGPFLGLTETHSPPPWLDELAVIQPSIPPLDWPILTRDWDLLPDPASPQPIDQSTVPKAEVVLVWVQHHTYRTEVYLSSTRYETGAMVTVEGDPGIDVGRVVASIPAEDVPSEEQPPMGTRRVLGLTTPVDSIRYNAAALKALHVMTVLHTFPYSDLDPTNDGHRDPPQFLGAHFQPDLQKLFLFHRGYLLREKISSKLFCRYQCRIWFEEITQGGDEE